MVRARVCPMAVTKMLRSQVYPDSSDPGALAKMLRATKMARIQLSEHAKCSGFQRCRFGRHVLKWFLRRR